MSARIARACLLAGGLLTLAPGAGAAEFYRYVDEQGVVHLTDVPTDPRFESFRLGPHRSTAARLIASRPS